MGYFPFFIDIKDKRFVVIGGGKVALRKIEKLIMFEPEIVVIAPEICREIKAMKGIRTVLRKFEENDLEKAFAVISASDDEKLNSYVFKLCCERNILVNTVDDIDKCGFVFPAVVKKNNITAGITTSGESPLFAKYLRERFEAVLDDKCMSAAETLGKYRPIVKEMFDTEQKRKKAMEALLELCLSKKTPSDEMINTMLEELKSRL